MNRKTDNIELDYPKDDIDCWNRYSKHRWVYELSRLLDAQGIKWSPFEVESLTDKVLNIDLISNDSIPSSPGHIYVRIPDGNRVITEVHILKGEIRNMRHFNPDTNEEYKELIGEIELRINAFVTLHFQKFTGVISIDTNSTEISRIRLRPHVGITSETNPDILKLVKRIFKRTDLTLNGPMDRVLHETLAS